MASKDLYGILGISKTASADEIKSAYRGLAKKYHPDVYATASDAEKKAAEEKFKDIQHAYDVLSDPQKKAAYDQFGSEDGPTMGGGGAGFNPFGDGAGFDDIFSNIFSGFGFGGSKAQRSRQARNGDDIECVVKLTFKEAAFGVVGKEISFNRNEKCSACNGTGSKSSSGVKTCSKCGGTGSVVMSQRTPFGVMQTRRVCPDCNGEGKIIVDKCTVCGGKGIVRNKHTVKINIPAGVDNDNSMTVRGHGSAAPAGGGQDGDLYLLFKVEPHPLFSREGTDISFILPITMTQAALGCKITVPTLKGTTEINIPEGTQNGATIRVKNEGIKNLRKDAYGDMYIHIIVEIPKGLSMKQKSALKDFDNLSDKGRYDRIDEYNRILRKL